MVGVALGRPGHGHPRQQRLRQKPEFDRVFERSQRSSLNEVGRPRLGLAVSVKAAGNGVGRNRIKRLAREAFRHLVEPPALDFVVTARPGLCKQLNPVLRASLDHHFRTLADRAAKAGG
jgi:ribonuclease P protein component